MKHWLVLVSIFVSISCVIQSSCHALFSFWTTKTCIIWRFCNIFVFWCSTENKIIATWKHTLSNMLMLLEVKFCLSSLVIFSINQSIPLYVRGLCFVVLSKGSLWVTGITHTNYDTFIKQLPFHAFAHFYHKRRNCGKFCCWELGLLY